MCNIARSTQCTIKKNNKYNEKNTIIQNQQETQCNTYRPQLLLYNVPNSNEGHPDRYIGFPGKHFNTISHNMWCTNSLEAT